MKNRYLFRGDMYRPVTVQIRAHTFEEAQEIATCGAFHAVVDEGDAAFRWDEGPAELEVVCERVPLDAEGRWMIEVKKG